MADSNHAQAAAERTIEDYKREIGELQARHDNLSRRFSLLKQNMDWAFRSPMRFAMSRMYHKWIKRDQIF